MTTQHTVDPKFTYRDKRTGKDVVQYVGLLDAAHRAGMIAMETEILQYPCAENDQTTIVHARATFPHTIRFFNDDKSAEVTEHRHFDGIGDANPRNVGANIAPHAIRMAETRAKARALRDALNVGMVTVEELGANDEDAPAPTAFDGHLDHAWRLAEDGATLAAIKDYLNANRHGMTKEQRALVQGELGKIEERFYAPVIAG